MTTVYEVWKYNNIIMWYLNLFPTVHSVSTCWWLGIGYGNTCILEISKHYKSEVGLLCC